MPFKRKAGGADLYRGKPRISAAELSKPVDEVPLRTYMSFSGMSILSVRVAQDVPLFIAISPPSSFPVARLYQPLHARDELTATSHSYLLP